MLKVRIFIVGDKFLKFSVMYNLYTITSKKPTKYFYFKRQYFICVTVIHFVQIINKKLDSFIQYLFALSLYNKK